MALQLERQGDGRVRRMGGGVANSREEASGYSTAATQVVQMLHHEKNALLN
jgi:hypothetical protein